CETKKKGGHLGFIRRKWSCFDEAFIRAAFDPALRPGSITGPVQSQYGYHLIRLNERKTGNGATFESIRDYVKKDFAEDLRQKIIIEQRKPSKVEIYRNVVEAEISG